jgi:hypothetical protein
MSSGDHMHYEFKLVSAYTTRRQRPRGAADWYGSCNLDGPVADASDDIDGAREPEGITCLPGRQ